MNEDNQEHPPIVGDNVLPQAIEADKRINFRKIFKYLGIGIVFFMISSIIYGTFAIVLPMMSFFGGPSSSVAVKQKEFTLNALGERYSEKFEIEKSVYYWNEGGDRRMEYLVHPIGDVQAKFHAELVIENEKDIQGKVNDYYVEVLSHEKINTQEIAAKMQDIFGDKYLFINPSLKKNTGAGSLVESITIVIRDESMANLDSEQERKNIFKEKYLGMSTKALKYLRDLYPQKEMEFDVDLVGSKSVAMFEQTMKYPGISEMGCGQVSELYENVLELFPDCNFSEMIVPLGDFDGFGATYWK